MSDGIGLSKEPEESSRIEQGLEIDLINSRRRHGHEFDIRYCKRCKVPARDSARAGLSVGSGTRGGRPVKVERGPRLVFPFDRCTLAFTSQCLDISRVS